MSDEAGRACSWYDDAEYGCSSGKSARQRLESGVRTRLFQRRKRRGN